MRSVSETPQNNENIIGDMQRDLEQMKLLLEEEKLRLNKDLVAERARCIEYENRCIVLERKIKKLEASGAIDSTSTSLYDILQVRYFIFSSKIFAYSSITIDPGCTDLIRGPVCCDLCFVLCSPCPLVLSVPPFAIPKLLSFQNHLFRLHIPDQVQEDKHATIMSDRYNVSHTILVV
ncbi:hypothetical protein BCR43DRAFT_160659 [Syncephalastrum racemosum]|uniref:Uncharacterized protein n=1 Tax=Syncephalastrum racemosum TaxID=13706 RepID=A0A1X2HNN6_SYNRA|nr:hypothetical protein BCR43DRAFT_160659 [Syncephalastrum racemosum]